MAEKAVLIFDPPRCRFATYCGRHLKLSARLRRLDATSRIASHRAGRASPAKTSRQFFEVVRSEVAAGKTGMAAAFRPIILSAEE